MKARAQLEERLERWVGAGVIDGEAAERIRSYEQKQERHGTLQWPVYLALGFGGILLAAGTTLFVAAHWARFSPGTRFALVLAMVVVFHAGGVLTAGRFAALSQTLHGVGTAVLGAAIFLAAQIFNLHENWATGVLLWAVGAACGYALLRDWVQATMTALLVPVWLISEWDIVVEWHSGGRKPLALGLILTALCYLSARIEGQSSRARRTLVWIGSAAVIPCAGIGIVLAMEDEWKYRGVYGYAETSGTLLLLCWIVAIAAPLALAWFTRGKAAWVNAVWAVWTWALVEVAARAEMGNTEHVLAKIGVYVLCAVGSVGLVAWGLREKRRERLNLGVAAFAFSVLFFYFDNFMDKMGRSASLVLLGMLCLVGGFALEMTRRRLVARMEVRA